MVDFISFSDLVAVPCAIVLGSMMFFSFAMAPLIFIKLPAETSGPFIRQVFPVYYLTLAILTAAVAVLCVPTLPLEATVMAVVSIAFVLARQVLMPRINRLRDAQLRGDPGAESNAFGALHRLSVAVNYLQLAAVAFVLVRVVD